MLRKYVLNVAGACENIFRLQLTPGVIQADRYADDISKVLFPLGAGPVVFPAQVKYLYLLVGAALRYVKTVVSPLSL